MLIDNFYIPQKLTKMKALITLGAISLIVLTGMFSFTLFLKDQFLTSGLFTAACLLTISFSISAVKPLEREDKEIKE
jgi:hypothetical protein